jgi:endonuclease/exonuclease/phosphatase family metal-dependent hydrolase
VTPRRLILVLAAAVIAVGGVAAVARTASDPQQARTPATKRPPVKKKVPVSRLKLLQFNVLQGALDGRWPAVAAVIEQSGADVVTLDEVNDEGVFEQIEGATGLHGLWVKANDAYSVGILSRYPLLNCTQYREAPIRHSAYGCRVVVGGKSWWIFGTHLYGFDEGVRTQEVRFLLAQMKPHLSGPLVFAGDFNAHTPGESPRTGLCAIPTLLRGGLIDSYRELRTAQQDPGFTITPPPYGNWERRIDYVFHSPAARAIYARVISSVAGYTWPSDHAALRVTLVAKPSTVRSQPVPDPAAACPASSTS